MIGDYYRYVAEAPKYLDEVKEGALEKDRIDLIEKIKYWSWNPFEERLENNLQKLEMFYKETKDSNPKQNVTPTFWFNPQKFDPPICFHPKCYFFL